MTNESFIDRWKAKEHELGQEDISTDFVTPAGCTLPASAAPCLNFDETARPLWEIYGNPKDWSETDRDKLSGYLAIGFDGAGNPLCVERKTSSIWLLDHECRFATRQFVNSSDAQFS